MPPTLADYIDASEDHDESDLEQIPEDRRSDVNAQLDTIIPE